MRLRMDSKMENSSTSVSAVVVVLLLLLVAPLFYQVGNSYHDREFALLTNAVY